MSCTLLKLILMYAIHNFTVDVCFHKINFKDNQSRDKCTVLRKPYSQINLFIALNIYYYYTAANESLTCCTAVCSINLEIRIL